MEEHDEETRERVEEKLEEKAAVEEADAVVDPGTVMIHVEDAEAARETPRETAELQSSYEGRRQDRGRQERARLDALVSKGDREIDTEREKYRDRDSEGDRDTYLTLLQRLRQRRDREKLRRRQKRPDSGGPVEGTSASQ